MDGAEDLVEPDAVLHGQHVFGDEVSGVFANEGDAEDLVLARHGQHLDEAMRLAVGNRAVKVVDAVGRHFVGNAFFLRFQFVQAHARDLRLNEGGPRDH